MKAHKRILENMERGKYYSFADVCEAMAVFATAGQYLKAWQDLTVNGRLQEGINNKYRINQ